MASIRKRGDLQWEARIRRQGRPTTCKTFDTKAEAERWAREIESEMDRGVFVSRPKPKIPLSKRHWVDILSNIYQNYPSRTRTNVWPRGFKGGIWLT